MPETAAVYIDLAKKTVAIEAKEGMKINSDFVSAEIKDAGYDVIKTETLAKSLAQIKSTMDKNHE
jgi:mercuric ion binding protein